LQVLAVSIAAGSFILALDLWATRGQLVEVKPVWFVVGIVLEIVVLVLLYRSPENDDFPEPAGFEMKLSRHDQDDRE
jgi:hypothetical protein